MKDLSSIVAKFKVQGTVEEIKPLGAGLINDTYKVNTKEADAPDYVLQRINHAMWKCFNPILPLSQAISVRN